LLDCDPGSAIGQVLLNIGAAGKRVPSHHQFESAGSRWLHGEYARGCGRHHGRMFNLCRRESDKSYDAEYKTRFHMAIGYASNSV
jgi:hypothetical protein